MLRRLFALFFVIASLTPQAGTAFSCLMMGGPPQQHCCCDPDEVAPANPDAAQQVGCCQPVVEIAAGPGDHSGGLPAGAKLPDYQPQAVSPVLAPVLLAFVLPSQVNDPGWYVPRDHGLYGTDLYLRTQRLRL
ncbi:hypothetical protein [Panacagrimonas sp.]|uniref:hypothetical protein n=1 Tax=Panacagrimonas sp. TaxID=2480088 RepID=UPI003B526E24